MLLWGLGLNNSFAGISFSILRQQDQCIDTDQIPATTGGQYVDSGNGVPDNSWSILKRWQNPLPLRDSFFHCDGGEIHINTWHVKHDPIVGGGFNDMAGYSWDSAHAPKAFLDGTNPADLVVQAYLGQTQTFVHLGTNRPQQTQPPILQVSLFAYLVDQSHPLLHPIAVIGLISDSRTLDPTFCSLSELADYPSGVWFWSFYLTCNDGKYNTNDPFGDETESIPAQYWAAQTPLTFVRMRISGQNLQRAILAINQSSCVACPAKGYSNNPQDYVVKYAGLIAEGTLLDTQDGSLGDPARDQISIGLNWRWIGIYRRVETP